MGDLQVCRRCAGSIHDPDQRTCPHCLEGLRTRSFRTREDLERFREDRRAHGAPVPEEDASGSSGPLALVLGLAATIMIVAGGTVAFAGIATGEVPRATRAIGQAIVPLAMGLGLFEMARRYGGGSA